MPPLDLAALTPRTGSIYPSAYKEMMQGRSSLRLAEAGGLTQYEVNLVRLEPGAMSSLRHCHQNEDAFVWVTMGECTLVQDGGAWVMRPGDCAAFPAGAPDGHHLVNRSDSPAAFLVVGTKAPQETAVYSDVDMMVTITTGDKAAAVVMHKDRTPWTCPRPAVE